MRGCPGYPRYRVAIAPTCANLRQPRGLVPVPVGALGWYPLPYPCAPDSPANGIAPGTAPRRPFYLRFTQAFFWQFTYRPARNFAAAIWTDRPSLAGKPTTGSFDIAPRKGYFSEGGSEWVPKPGRHAHVYILAWHPIADETEADHRDPAQWLFFIVPAKQLPQDQKTISRTVVEKRWSAVRFEQLRERTLNTSKKLLKD